MASIRFAYALPLCWNFPSTFVHKCGSISSFEVVGVNLRLRNTTEKKTALNRTANSDRRNGKLRDQGTTRAAIELFFGLYGMWRDNFHRFTMDEWKRASSLNIILSFFSLSLATLYRTNGAKLESCASLTIRIKRKSGLWNFRFLETSV